MSRPLPDIAGADAVLTWYGEWPSFHDAEILELRLHRKGLSAMTVHTWRSTNETFERDGKQYFKSEKHAVVISRFRDIVDLELSDFSSQNVISGLEIERVPEAHRLILHPCYGLVGFIEAREISVELRPGEPEPEP